MCLKTLMVHMPAAGLCRHTAGPQPLPPITWAAEGSHDSAAGSHHSPVHLRCIHEPPETAGTNTLQHVAGAVLQADWHLGVPLIQQQCLGHNGLLACSLLRVLHTITEASGQLMWRLLPFAPADRHLK